MAALFQHSLPRRLFFLLTDSALDAFLSALGDARPPPGGECEREQNQDQ